jgi:acyl-CoA thioesterase
MTPSSLDDVLTPSAGTLEIADGWQQGRGAFGGLVLGALTRALEAEAASGRPLRTLSASLLAPVVPGRARIAVEVLRAGSAVTSARAAMLQDDAVVAQASAVFGAARAAAPSWDRLSPPAAPPWQSLPAVAMPSPPAPVFTRHFDMRVCAGYPFSGAPEAEVLGWVRPRVTPRRRDAALIVALADCYFPVVLSQMTSPRPVATVSFGIDLCAPLDGLDPEAPVLHRATSPFARDGYVVEQRELWGADGRLLALNQQTFVVIK